MPPSLLYQQRRSPSTPSNSPSPSLMYRQSKQGPTLVPPNLSLDWPEARFVQTAPSSPAPSFHSEESNTDIVRVPQAPTFAPSQSEESWTFLMAPHDPPSQNFDPISSPVQAPSRQGSAPRRNGDEPLPVRDGGLELLEHRYPIVLPRRPLPDSSPRFDPRHML